MKLYETTISQVENPTFLWETWKAGPASDYDRIKDRVTVLVAQDVLENCPDRLDDSERQLVRELVEGDDV